MPLIPHTLMHICLYIATNTLHICLYIWQLRRLRKENERLREENEKLRNRNAEIDAMGQVLQGDVLAQVFEKCSPTDAEIVNRFMHKHVIIGEYFPKENIDMGEIVPKHIDDMVRHLCTYNLQGNFPEYVSQEYEWAMVEHPEWFGGEERDEDEEEEGEIEMTEEEGIAHWQMMRAEMREQVRQEVLEKMRGAGASD